MIVIPFRLFNSRSSSFKQIQNIFQQRACGVRLIVDYLSFFFTVFITEKNLNIDNAKIVRYLCVLHIELNNRKVAYISTVR